MKRIGILGILCALLILIPVTACRAETSRNDNITNPEEYDEQLRASGADQLYDDLPRETQEILDGLGIAEIDSGTITSLSPDTFIASLGELVSQASGGPLKSAAIIIGIILLCALFDTMKSSFSSSALGGTFSVVSALATASAVIVPVLDCIHRAGEAIKSGTIFMYAFIPVFTGILVTSGRPVTGSVYSGLLFFIAEILSILSSTILVPFLSIFLAFSLISSVTPSLGLQKTAESIQKTVSWVLGIAMTIFVGLLSVQGIVGASADTVTLKTAKFVAGSFIPVVGSAIGDAVASVQSCLGLLKSSVGAFGIITIAILFLPVLFECILWQVSLNICSSISEMFELKALTSILKGAGTALKLLTAIIFSSMLVLLISTTIILMMGGGA